MARPEITQGVLSLLDPRNPSSNQDRTTTEGPSTLKEVRVSTKISHRREASPTFLVSCDWGWAETVVAEVPYLHWARGIALAISEVCGEVKVVVIL